jgi:ribonuclease HII
VGVKSDDTMLSKHICEVDGRFVRFVGQAFHYRDLVVYLGDAECKKSPAKFVLVSCEIECHGYLQNAGNGIQADIVFLKKVCVNAGSWCYNCDAMIVGVDEVGRGCWAGPVCVAAVAQHPNLEGIVDDSKKLSAAQRQVIAQLVKEQTAVGIGWASHAFIDAHGLTAALKYAAIRAIIDLGPPVDEILLDGNSNYLGDKRVRTIVHGDAIEPAIAAASIVAKVARDNYMRVVGEVKFAGYGFESHVGYGTAVHRAALANMGPCPIHRMSFAPLKVYVD